MFASRVGFQRFKKGGFQGGFRKGGIPVSYLLIFAKICPKSSDPPLA